MFTWNNVYWNELFHQIYIQLVRENDISSETKSIDNYAFLIKFTHECITNEKEKKEKLDLLIKLMIQTRDIVVGKGECLLFYYLFKQWLPYKMYYNYLYSVLYYLTHSNTVIDHPYGSWKDIKYLLYYCKDELREGNEILQFAIYMAVYESYNNKDSLVSKWLPREKSKKFGWLTPYFVLALHRYNKNFDYLHSIHNITKKQWNYMKMNYRKYISNLNQRLDTMEIALSRNRDKQNIIDNILSNKSKGITSKNIYKYHKSILKYSIDNNLSINIFKFCKNINHIQIGDIIHLVWNYIKNDKKYNKEKEYILHLWNSYKQKVYLDLLSTGDNTYKNDKQKIIPCIDLSYTMERNIFSIMTSIGYCILLLEFSEYKKILHLSCVSEWIEITNDDDIFTIVKKIYSLQSRGLESDIYKGLNLIHKEIEMKQQNNNEYKMHKIIVFSDMLFHIPDIYTNNKSELYKNTNTHTYTPEVHRYIYEIFQLNNTHYLSIPMFYFWNMRQTSVFPFSSYMTNMFLLSGYSLYNISNILDNATIQSNNEEQRENKEVNIIITQKEKKILNKEKKQLEVIQETTMENIINILSNERYKWVEDISF